MYDIDTMRLHMDLTLRETQRQGSRIKTVASAHLACARSIVAHCDALSRGERPGPGWWEVPGGRFPRWRGEKLVMRYRLPRLPDAKRAREGGE